jgi:hypothetical protein
MTFEETLMQVFPAGTLGYSSGAPGFSFEMNGLAAATMPVADEILARGHHTHTAEGERREQFLVKTPSFLLFFRICSAGTGFGYDEFATGRAYPADGPEMGNFLEKSRDMLERLCG